MALHAQGLVANDWNNWPTTNEFTVNLTPSSLLGQVAASQGPGGIVDALNALMMHGTMSSSMRSSIVQAITGLDTGTMTRNAVYLVITSPEYRLTI